MDQLHRFLFRKLSPKDSVVFVAQAVRFRACVRGCADPLLFHGVQFLSALDFGVLFQSVFFGAVPDLRHLPEQFFRVGLAQNVFRLCQFFAEFHCQFLQIRCRLAKILACPRGAVESGIRLFQQIVHFSGGLDDLLNEFHLRTGLFRRYLRRAVPDVLQELFFRPAFQLHERLLVQRRGAEAVHFTGLRELQFFLLIRNLPVFRELIPLFAPCDRLFYEPVPYGTKE